MAIYHLSVKNISRGKGYSAVRNSAYIARDKVEDKELGEAFDYSHKTDNIYSEIIAPQQASDKLKSRENLWNEIHKVEKGQTARLAKEIEVSLPKELNKDEHIKLIQEYVKKNFTDKNIIADVNIHHIKNNPHAHIMIATRGLDENGNFSKAKSKKMYCLDDEGNKIKLANGKYKTYKLDLIDVNSTKVLQDWRKSWADITNKYLERNLITEKIDHRSYEEQGIEKLPTVHLGKKNYEMEKRGEKTDKGNINRHVYEVNTKLDRINDEIIKLQSEKLEKTPEHITIISKANDLLNRTRNIVVPNVPDKYLPRKSIMDKLPTSTLERASALPFNMTDNRKKEIYLKKLSELAPDTSITLDIKQAIDRVRSEKKRFGIFDSKQTSRKALGSELLSYIEFVKSMTETQQELNQKIRNYKEQLSEFDNMSVVKSLLNRQAINQVKSDFNNALHTYNFNNEQINELRNRLGVSKNQDILSKLRNDYNNSIKHADELFHVFSKLEQTEEQLADVLKYEYAKNYIKDFINDVVKTPPHQIGIELDERLKQKLTKSEYERFSDKLIALEKIEKQELEKLREQSHEIDKNLKSHNRGHGFSR